VMGTALVVGGVVMWLIDWMNSKSEAAGEAVGANSRIHTWRMDNMSLGQAMWIGACQILSGVFPGTSRSMSTITAGQIAGMSRAAALEFSFFLSMPTMAMAVAYSLFKSMRGKDENPIGVAQIDGHQWIVLLIGLAVSFVVAYGAVAWFMGWVRKRGFAPFAVYRIILGAVVLYYATRMAG
jgi:undecaprenyl-diphosphatase